MLYLRRSEERENFWKDFFNWDVKGELLKTDIKEDEKNYLIHMDVPGVSKENIGIEVKDGYLIVSVTRKSEDEKNEDKYIRRERHYGEYQRSFYVGDVDEKDIVAKSLNGVLAISIPKEDNRKIEKKTINIDWQ